MKATGRGGDEDFQEMNKIGCLVSHGFRVITAVKIGGIGAGSYSSWKIWKPLGAEKRLEKSRIGDLMSQKPG